jgi:hypothetical protein
MKTSLLICILTVSILILVQEFKMPVIYGGTAIIPGPQVVLKKQFQEMPDGRFVGTLVGATLNGFLVSSMDGYTPQFLSLDQKLGVIIAKQLALRAIFQTDGQYFEVQGFDGSAPVKFNARVKSIDFSEGDNWVEACPYTVELEGVNYAGEDVGTPYYVDSSSETWSFEDTDVNHVYKVNHTMSAKGKTVYLADGSLPVLAWQQAKSFVTTQLSPGWTTLSSPWSPQSGETIWGGAVDNDPEVGGVAYNRILTESIDELDGTYSLTESYILSPNNYTQELTVSVRRVTNEPMMTTVVSMQGVIHGLFITLHDYEQKLINAKAAWTTIEPTLFTIASGYVPSVSLNTRPVDGSFDENPNAGTISYNYSYNDRILTNNTFETYTISRKSNYNGPVVGVSVSGSIQGILFADDTDPTQKYVRALAQWNITKLLLYDRALTEWGGLKAYPTENSVDFDSIGGSVNYSFTFDTRPISSVIDDFSVTKKYSRADGRTTITVAGTIQGLYTSETDIGDPDAISLERYTNALAYWNGISDNLLGRANTVSIENAEVNPVPYGTSVVANQWNATISYENEYTNLPTPLVAGALSEIITVVDNLPYEIIAIQAIPGRSAGPIFQDVGTKTQGRRAVTFEIVMPVTFSMSSEINSGAYLPPTIDPTPFAPTFLEVSYMQEPSISWSPSTGRLQANYSWVYV